MKRKEETVILAEEAFWAILASGKPPTVDLINAWLLERGNGKRDRNVVNSVAKECWEKVAGRVKDSFALPGIPAETVGLFVKLREDLLAVARAELDADRAEVESATRAAIEAARQEVISAQGERDEALAARRETAAAFEAVAAERDGLRKELLTAQQSNEAERERRIRAEKALEVLSARMEAETSRFAAEREAAEADRKRQLLEIDGLRVELRATKEAEKDAHAKLNDTVARERDLAARAAELVEQLGVAKGAERVLSAQVGDMSRDIERLRAELTSAVERAVRATDQIERLKGDAHALSAALEERAAITEEQLNAALIQAWLNGATSAPKASRGDDPTASLTPRATRYATSAMLMLGKTPKK
ncbi:hypothetical protein [Burkholderia sp. Tr-20390]|uniref:hypothetical protein n=1 Tax=Burkholderia sp. Tr-20390 TaxID=2703904 RepID=UPI00197CC358|nr:hypothetical protein [Burkholderia sp. Tr-20390]MBN3729469.1 hypothetical protein [Burkholderia sp. Tr-20390]